MLIRKVKDAPGIAKSGAFDNFSDFEPNSILEDGNQNQTIYSFDYEVYHDVSQKYTILPLL
jgi:hypothetical protein